MGLDVLLADGNPMLAAAYEAFLTAEGFRVAVVTTGIECLQQLRQNPPRLLVLDPGIPWGGLGVLAVVAERGDVPLVPVLVLTDGPSDIILELEAPHPLAVVLKPVTPAALAALVKGLELWGEGELSPAEPILLTTTT